MSLEETIQYTCECGKKLKIQSKLLGRKLKCPNCSSVFTVPNLEDKSSEPEIVEEESSDRITGTINWPGFSSASGPTNNSLKLYLDDHLIGTGTVFDGIKDAEFESNIGNHLISVEFVPITLMKLFKKAADLEKIEKFPINCNQSGHYTIDFKKPSLLKAFSNDRFICREYDTKVAGSCKKVTKVVTERKNLLIGLWEESSGSGTCLQFTNDGGMLRHDGFSLKYRWTGYHTIELYMPDVKETISYSIVSLGDHELILKVEGQIIHFKKGVTLSEIEAAKKAEEARRIAAENSKIRAEMATSFLKGAAGVSSVLAAGGLAVLAGGVGVGVAAAGVAQGVSGGGGRRQDGDDLPAPSPRSLGSGSPPSTQPKIAHNQSSSSSNNSNTAPTYNHIALCGAVIIKSDGPRCTYKHKCDSCGHLEPGTTTSSVNSTSVLNSSFMCTKCKSRQEVKLTCRKS